MTTILASKQLHYADLPRITLEDLHPEVFAAVCTQNYETQLGCRRLVAYLSLRTGMHAQSIQSLKLLTRESEHELQRIVGVNLNSFIQTVRKGCRALGRSDLFPERIHPPRHPEVDAWTSALGVDTRRASTLRHGAMGFLRWATNTGRLDSHASTVSVFKIQRQHVEEYRTFLFGQVSSGKLTRSAVRNKLKLLVRWLNWLKGNGKIFFSTKKLVPKREDEQIKRKLPDGVSILSFFRGIVKLRSNREVSYLYFLLLLATGARPIEILHLKRGDLDFTSRSIRLQSKGGRERWVPLPENIWMLLERVISSHTQEFGLVRESGKPLDFNWSVYTFKNILKLSGSHIDGQMAFRHRFATDCLNQSLDLTTTLYLLGHKSASELHRYQHIHEKKLASDVNRAFKGVFS